MKNNIIILGGDPNSINSEIIYKTWNKVNKKIKRKFCVIANYNLILAQFKKLKLKIKITKIKNFNENIKNNNIKIIDVPLNFKDPFNVPLKVSSIYVKKCLDLANKISLEGKIKGFINCPIDKKLIKTKEIHGVTEYLARKSNVNINSEVMMLFNRKLSVVPITTHIDIKKISLNITKNIIDKKIKVLNKDFMKIFKRKPKIAVLGLNPHNGELTKNSEEVKIIIPAIYKLKKDKLNITGPIPADTIFVKDYKQFDVIIGMYHDQVLIPFKTLFKFNAINITLGLKYIRVSPDHGTAVKLIGKNKANYLSLFECVNFIYKLN
ncbi:4-hydroxythreonine-4-phosphate dehydrogenase PdxA [Pelagibacteraceae bacterium]|nr:4-hydroxythreonine-4-phosphate dehydrogenase PdxA [Pelagibacteraceae bacterium]